MTYVYCRNKDASKCAHHLWGVWGIQQDSDSSGVFSFPAWAVLPSQREQIGFRRVGWSEAAHFGNSWPGAFGQPQQVRPDKVEGGTVCSATGRHSPTRGQEELWDFSPLPSPIHYFLLQMLFSPLIFSASTETLMLSSPGTQLFPHHHHNPWVGRFYIKINRSLKTPREAGRQH